MDSSGSENSDSEEIPVQNMPVTEEGEEEVSFKDLVSSKSCFQVMFLLRFDKFKVIKYF